MSKKRKILLIVFGILIILLVVAVYLIIAFLNRPANGVITQPKNSQIKSESTPSFDFSPVAVSDKYANFTYPAAMKTYPTTEKIKLPTLTEYNYTYPDVESWFLSIDILSISGGNITTNSAYQFRKDNPTTYVQLQEMINGQEVIIMSDKTAPGFSEVAFLANANYQATISLYGNDLYGLGNLLATLNQVLKSWHWQSS